MNKTLNKILLTASFLSFVAAAGPALANPSVLCSVRANYDAAGSDAAYKPGVDAQGRAVVPADVAAPAVSAPSALRIPLTVDLAQRLNEVLPEGGKLDAQIGVIEVRQDGKVFFNGQDLTGPATAMCDNLEKQKAAALRTPDAPKAKKTAPVKKAAERASAPAADGPVMESMPVTPVEPQVLQDTTPQAQPQPEPEPQPVMESAPAPAPAPAETAAPAEPPLPAPETLLNPPADTPRFPGEAVAPAQPAPDALTAPSSPDAILSPAEGGMMPRPPMDPLASEPERLPAPSPMSNDANGGMLSGGTQ